MDMDLKHVTAYLEPKTFDRMERLRKRRRRITRSEWIDEAVLEKIQRDETLSIVPEQEPSRKKAAS